MRYYKLSMMIISFVFWFFVNNGKGRFFYVVLRRATSWTERIVVVRNHDAVSEPFITANIYIHYILSMIYGLITSEDISSYVFINYF